MKVYVVVREWDHETSTLLGVRATPESARALAEKDASERWPTPETVAWKPMDEDGDQFGYPPRGKFGIDHCWAVYEREVQQ